MEIRPSFDKLILRDRAWEICIVSICNNLDRKLTIPIEHKDGTQLIEQNLTHSFPIKTTSKLFYLLFHIGNIPMKNPSHTLMITKIIYFCVHWSGSSDRSKAAFSAGKPKASQPMQWTTLLHNRSEIISSARRDKSYSITSHSIITC